MQFLPSIKELILAYAFTATTLENSTTDFQSRCLSFQPLNFISNASIRVQEYVPAGTVITEAHHEPDCLTEASQTVSVNMCRIAMNITTSPSSFIVFEAWFPDAYNDRLFTVGTSGMGGCIRYIDLDFGVGHSFATVASNNGHEGNRAEVFYNHSEVLEDFSWRALHTTTQAGKRLVPEFYSNTINKSYFSGCSGAGRQGIKAAEMWPEDYDGIIVGAPAENYNNMQSWVLSFYGKTGDKSSPDFIDAGTWTGLIHTEILNQCDLMDGVADGIIEDPTLCNFRPEALICEGGKIESCLTSAQVEIVRNVFSPLYGYDGKLVFPAMQPGSEEMAVSKLYTGVPYDYAFDWFRYVVYADPNYTTSEFGVSSMAKAASLDPFNISSSPDTLSPFVSSPHNGKMILWHGQADQEITSFESERWYNKLSRGMNLTSSSMDSFIRFFRISGVWHCRGGAGAWMIGQETEGEPIYDRKNSVLKALVDWVEEGVPPETITGTKFVNDDPNQGIERTRRHCRYPYRNTYLGNGLDGNDADSWECRMPGQGTVVGSVVP
ncbi:tannase and feruloyl esterase [Mollisia scopiformis]|uniref:Carboxylic ester hydrolase n=1 Tax=Mollisia scopiformis TaxID=149040 RepID=A0A132BAC2_MOLSC|nr:tannase and feruloyl esterase [Mollisia scopiformis]KUJ09331.1 tannase and feruloyl esterase [Mollisia scopiformis]